LRRKRKIVVDTCTTKRPMLTRFKADRGLIGEAGELKKAKLRRRLEELEASLSDLGILAAKLDISPETDLSFRGSLPAVDMREFMTLWRDLHRDYLCFGERSRA
jgi:hypothetical protein